MGIGEAVAGIGAGIGGLAGLFGGGGGGDSGAYIQAAQIQANAALQGQQVQKQMYEEARASKVLKSNRLEKNHSFELG